MSGHPKNLASSCTDTRFPTSQPSNHRFGDVHALLARELHHFWFQHGPARARELRGDGPKELALRFRVQLHVVPSHAPVHGIYEDDPGQVRSAAPIESTSQIGGPRQVKLV